MKQSNFLTLFKFNLKYFLFPRFQTKKDKRRYFITMAIVGFALLIPIISLLASVFELTRQLPTIENAENILSSLFFLGQIITLVFSLSTYLQVMYLSKDKAILATLPVSQTEIYLSKILTVTAMEMLVSTILTVPTTIVVAIALAVSGIHVGVLYYLLIPVAMITLPLLVVLIVSILSFPIMKLFSILKKHQTLGAILTVLLIVGIMMAIYIPIYSNIPSANVDVEGGEEYNPFVGINDTITKIGSVAYHTKSLAKVMLNDNAGINFLIYFGITLGALALGIGLSIILFKSTILDMDENATSNTTSQKEYVASSIKKTLILREIKTISRDMGKLINVLMAFVMGPAIVFIMLFIMQMNSKGAEASEVAVISSFGLGFTLGYSALMIGGANTGCSVGMSLEGANFAVLKTLPVNGVDIFKAKLFVMDICGCISALLSFIISIFFVRMNAIDIIGYLICAPLVIVSANAYSLKRDLKKPKLNWTIIKDITKNNFSTLIPLLVMTPYLIVSIALPITFNIIFGNNEYLASGITWAILLVASIVYYFALRFKKFGDINKLFDEVEA